MRLRLTLLLCVVRLLAVAGPANIYEWEKDRKRYVLSEKEQSYNEYVLKYHRQYNYEWEDKAYILYYTEHRITRVTNSETIQRHNRIYISLNDVLDLVEIKARAMNKNGKVTLFDQSNLKEIKDDTDNSYKIFAIEGIEPDSELEYYYTVKKNGTTFETVYFQFETPMKSGSLKVTCPDKLAFSFKTYFDNAKVTSDTLQQKNIYTTAFSDVPGLANEKMSFFDANRKRVEMKLAYNYTRSGARLNTWTDAAKLYYKSLTDINDESEKQAIKFVKTLGDDKKWPAVQRIKNVEDKIKNSIKIGKRSSDGAQASIDNILKYKQASVEGIMRLFVFVYDQLQIPMNVVVTSNRELKKFDTAFDSWTYLNEYLLFFPETNGFLSPNENELRYPLVPSRFTANKGLFIEPIVVGTIKSGIGSIKDIPALPYTADQSNHAIAVSFNEDLEMNTIDQKLIFIGMNASYMSSYYGIMTLDQRNQFVGELLRSTVPDIAISKWTASGSEQSGFPKFEIDANFTSGHFLEKAGNKILFKVGELIGPQNEMYRDENRATDIENTNNRGFEREITIEIPKGYKISNTDALTMNVLYKNGDEVPFLFTSEFDLQKSTLKILVKEYYKEVYAPLSRYEDFRKVINAAADFNKIVLVLEKI